VKQVLQNIRNGKLSVEDIPAPLAQPGEILIANEASLVSAGTEKMIMDLAKKSLLGKARERPDHLKRVLQKIKQDGLLPTIRAVRSKLDEPMTMGYASAGTVLAVGEGVSGIQAGDRVASNGPHAEVVSVAKNLCAKVPDGVPMSHAAFAVLGSIALQGIRLSKATLGERVLVIGLGLIGQLTVSILRSAGCRVIATDLDESKCKLALEMGAEDARPGLSASHVEQWSDGVGADAVLITASTKSNGPITLAADAVRQKGRVVLVGVVGLELDRRPFYFKEAEFVVSCSYGPGRYDPEYEDKGHDYPIGHVRWTEQRNLQAVLDLMRNDGLRLDKLISHRFPIERGTEAYELIEKGNEPYLGIVLEYTLPEAEQEERHSPTLAIKVKGRKDGKIGIGFLGAGNFARSVLIPTAVKTAGFKPIGICSAGGVSAAEAAKKHGFPLATTDEDAIFDNPDIDAIFIATRHNLHARQVIRALEQGKHVYVEKPLCLTLPELTSIDRVISELGPLHPTIHLGCNRRFTHAAQVTQSLLTRSTTPSHLIYHFAAPVSRTAIGYWTPRSAEAPS
jgi:threonine dehydrogenase-like Zn-dependent dehydrogenase